MVSRIATNDSCNTMQTLTHTLEKVGILVTLMFVLGRTGFVARLAVRPARQGPVPVLALFTLMALTESWDGWMDVVNHYNGFLKLGLTDADKADLIEYLKSL